MFPHLSRGRRPRGRREPRSSEHSIMGVSELQDPGDRGHERTGQRVRRAALVLFAAWALAGAAASNAVAAGGGRASNAVAAGGGRASKPVAPVTRVEVVQTTADLSQRLSRLPDLIFGPGGARGLPDVLISEQARYQTISGFGGALTDTSGLADPRRAGPVERPSGAGAAVRGAGHRPRVPAPADRRFGLHGHRHPVLLRRSGAGSVRSDAGPVLDRPRPGLHLADAQTGTRDPPRDGDPGQPVDPAGVDEGQRLAFQRLNGGTPAQRDLRALGAVSS